MKISNHSKVEFLNHFDENIKHIQRELLHYKHCMVEVLESHDFKEEKDQQFFNCLADQAAQLELIKLADYFKFLSTDFDHTIIDLMDID